MTRHAFARKVHADSDWDGSPHLCSGRNLNENATTGWQSDSHRIDTTVSRQTGAVEGLLSDRRQNTPALKQ
jgi:hypothetical protein